MLYPETINNLIEYFKKMPGVGEKTAERMALCCLELDEESNEIFAQSLLMLKKNIKRCKRCNNLTESEVCSICSNESRNQNIICVVQDVKNVFQFEKIGSYNGLYHVLDGLISPLDDINPEDLNIKSLIDRIDNENIKEVIIAVKPSMEGKTTSLYISKMLESKDIVVSEIAYGVPMGADMDYVDALTLELALEERKNINKNE